VRDVAAFLAAVAGLDKYEPTVDSSDCYQGMHVSPDGYLIDEDELNHLIIKYLK